jgi:homoserine O-acetyltransferase
MDDGVAGPVQDARQYAELPAHMRLYRGGELSGGRIAFETWGRLSSQRDNAILLFTGLSPAAHAASSTADPRDGWWEAMLGPGLAIDTDRYFVICINSLGGCFGSSGPASIDPGTGERWGVRFPEVAVEDIARGGFEVLRHLRIRQLAAVIGPSLGGMVVLSFVAQYPDVARRLVCISGTAAAAPVAIALRSVQREAILRDPQWKGGNYHPDEPPRTGMRLARKLGTVTYRSAAEWNQRFGREPLAASRVTALPGGFSPHFAIEGYLESQAERFVRSFDANSYLYLSRAMDRFELLEHGPSLAAIFARAQLEAALVIGVESDFLFAIGEQATVAAGLETAGVPTTFARLASVEGHDAFLVDIASFDPAIRRFLAAN